MFVSAPAICVHIESFVRLDDCKKRSKVISKYKNTEPMETILRYEPA